MSATCRLCGNAVYPNAPATFDLCGECAIKLGVAPMGPPCRPARPCDRCNGMKFVRVVPRELTATGVDYVNEQAAPMALTIVPNLTEKFFGGRRVDAPNPWNGRGRLETYVCVGCGFVEWYCIDPKTIPLGPEFMADIVDYGPKDPYR